MIEAGSSEERPDLFDLVIAARGDSAGAAANPLDGRNAKRALLRATGEYLWKCDDNGGLRTLDDRTIFPSAMPRCHGPNIADISTSECTSTVRLSTACPNCRVHPSTSECEYECHARISGYVPVPHGRSTPYSKFASGALCLALLTATVLLGRFLNVHLLL